MYAMDSVRELTLYALCVCMYAIDSVRELTLYALCVCMYAIYSVCVFATDSVRELEEIHPIRYAKHITLHVEMQPGKSQIYPPYLEVTYAVATSSDYEQGNKTEVRLVHQYCIWRNKRTVLLKTFFLLNL